MHPDRVSMVKSSTLKGEDLLYKLPCELWFAIFSWLPLQDYVECTRVSIAWFKQLQSFWCYYAKQYRFKDEQYQSITENWMRSDPMTDFTFRGTHETLWLELQLLCRSLYDIESLDIETYREADDQFLLRLLRDTTAAPTRLAYQDFMGYNVTWQAIQQALQKFPKLDRFRFVQLEDTVPAPRVPTSLFASRTTSFPSLTHLQLSFNLARLRYESTAKAVIRLIELCPKLRHIALDPDDYVGHNSLIIDNVLGSLANNLASFVLTFRASTPHPLPQKGNGLQLLHLGSKATCSFIDGYFPVLRYAAEQLEVLHLDFDGLMPWPSSSPEIASFPRLRNVFVEQQLPPTLVTMLHASPVVTHLTLRRLKEEDSGYLSKLLSGLLQLRYLVVEGDARLFSTELIGHSLKPLSNLEHLVLEHLAITGALAEILLRLPRLQSL